MKESNAPLPDSNIPPVAISRKGDVVVSEFPQTCDMPELEARQSQIPGADKGLFTKVDIKKNQVIVEYAGKILTLGEARKAKNRTYLKVVSFNRHIDASGEDASIAKFINDNLDKSKVNVKFTKIVKPASKDSKKIERIFVLADRDIEAGEELFVSYGRSHWLFGGIPAFLGLEIHCDHEGAKAVRATENLPKGEILCVYNSSHLDIKPAEGDIGPTIGELIQYAPESQVNCRLMKNPFIPETTMVTATVDIKPGDTLYLSNSEKLEPRTSTIAGAGLGAFARRSLKSGERIGAYVGTVLTMSGFRNKLANAPGAAGYAFQFDVQADDGKMIKLVVDPTNEKGTVHPARNSPVCFINEKSNDAEDPCHNCKFQFHKGSGNNDGTTSEWMVQVVTTKDVPKDAELFLHYGNHFFRKWLESELEFEQDAKT